MMNIPYGRQFLEADDESAVLDVLQSDWLTCGPAVSAFEDALCQTTGARHAIACANGTAALHLACLALGIGKGDHGITSPITFLASANCVEFVGGTIDFADIDSSTLCISPGELEKHCRDKGAPAVVIPVDFAGVPADLPAIWDLARRYGFRVIEDAAHALGSTYDHEGKTITCGSCEHSDLATLSFHPVKTITTGEGGAITTSDDLLAERLRRFRNHGMVKTPAMEHKHGGWYYEMSELGYNYRITDLQCALGSSQLKKLLRFKERRQAIVKRYNDAFGNHEGLVIPPWPEGTDPCFHLYPLQFRSGSEKRRDIYNALKANGIIPQVHYIPVYHQPYYAKKYGFAQGKCPNAEKYYADCLSLPLYPAMVDVQADEVIEKVLSHI